MRLLPVLRRVVTADQPNGMRGAASEMAYGYAEGGTLRRVNPKSGSGMKQGQQVWGGSKRHEVEKT
jgi:hypothetical protein